jgi:starvation-inducible DNA-binding protein
MSIQQLIKGSSMRSNHPGVSYQKLQVFIQPNIGLDSDVRQSVVEILNTLLADEAVLTMKTKSAYWHARGPGFLELQNLFHQQISQLNTISEEIEERVRILGGFAISSFKEFLQYARLEEQPGEVPDMMRILADQEATIRYLREDARKCFEEYEDHGTFTLFVHFIRLHEQMAWVLRSSIEPDMTL